MVVKKLNAEYKKALEKARASVATSDVEMIDSEIQAIYELGEHPVTGHPIQSGEFIVDGKVRNMIFSETSTIQAIFGEVKADGNLSNIGYVDGVAKTLKVPDIKPDAKDQYWFTLPKK